MLNFFFNAIFFIIILSGLVPFKTNATEEENMLKQKTIIEIANKAINKLGYDTAAMEMELIFHEHPWNVFFPKESMSKYVVVRRNKLANKKYWAVYFYKTVKKDGPIYKGGDVCIFINAKTGDILTTYRGK